MSDLEKPKVIKVSGTGNLPKVVSIGSERPVKVWIPPQGESSPSDALSFVARYRDFARLDPEYGFQGADIERMTQFLKAAPLRFIFEKSFSTDEGNVGHWLLYIRTLAPHLRVYDPAAGVKDLGKKENVHSIYEVKFNNSSEAKWGPEITEKKGNISVTHRDLLNPPSEAEYELSEAALNRLGPVQKRLLIADR